MPEDTNGTSATKTNGNGKRDDNQFYKFLGATLFAFLVIKEILSYTSASTSQNQSKIVEELAKQATILQQHMAIEAAQSQKLDDLARALNTYITQMEERERQQGRSRR